MPEIVVIHGGKIVMDEGIDMHTFGGGGRTQGRLRRNPEERGTLADEKGTEPLAAAKRGVAHRLGQTAFRTFGPRQKTIEHLRHIIRRSRERGFE